MTPDDLKYNVQYVYQTPALGLVCSLLPPASTHALRALGKAPVTHRRGHGLGLPSGVWGLGRVVLGGEGLERSLMLLKAANIKTGKSSQTGYLCPILFGLTTMMLSLFGHTNVY